MCTLLTWGLIPYILFLSFTNRNALRANDSEETQPLHDQSIVTDVTEGKYL